MLKWNEDCIRKYWKMQWCTYYGILSRLWDIFNLVFDDFLIFNSYEHNSLIINYNKKQGGHRIT